MSSQELEEGDVSSSSTAVAICKQGLAEAIMAKRPRWRRQEDAAEAENLLREALATFQQAPMQPSLIADLHVRQLTTLVYHSQHRVSRTPQNSQKMFSLECCFIVTNGSGSARAFQNWSQYCFGGYFLLFMILIFDPFLMKTSNLCAEYSAYYGVFIITCCSCQRPSAFAADKLQVKVARIPPFWTRQIQAKPINRGHMHRSQK